MLQQISSIIHRCSNHALVTPIDAMSISREEHQRILADVLRVNVSLDTSTLWTHPSDPPLLSLYIGARGQIGTQIYERHPRSPPQTLMVIQSNMIRVINDDAGLSVVSCRKLNASLYHARVDTRAAVANVPLISHGQL